MQLGADFTNRPRTFAAGFGLPAGNLGEALKDNVSIIQVYRA